MFLVPGTALNLAGKEGELCLYGVGGRTQGVSAWKSQFKKERQREGETRRKKEKRKEREKQERRGERK